MIARFANRTAAVGLMLVLTGCRPPAPSQKAADQLQMQELMVHVMQHSADGVWKWQGYEIDAAGEHSLFPKTDAEWEEAESAALTLSEVTHALELPGRRVDEPQWDQAVADVRTVALEAAKAAEKHDEDAFFLAGEKLDQACDVCHARYDPAFDPRFQH